MTMTSTARPPCGCSGHPTSSAAATSSVPSGAAGTTGGGVVASGCGCGSGCSSCGQGGTPTGGFSRPAYFGGMLLTEDDLQAQVDYIIGKRRLTNRYVLGSGVVCGLDVECAPCERGSVVVAPGYAIDCCGNDVVVGCPETVDILALLQALRARNGTDCGQPCDDDPCTYYYLSVGYAEQPTDPVAPYSQDDCAIGGCEYSRVRETYRFELTCDPPEGEPGLMARLRECLPSKNERTKEDAAVMARVVQIAGVQDQIATAGAAAMLKNLTPPVKADYEALDKSLSVQSALQLIGRSLVVLSAGAARSDGGPDAAGTPAGPAAEHLAYRVSAPRQASIQEQTTALADRLATSAELAAGTADDRDLAAQLRSMLQDRTALARLTDLDRVWLAQGLTQTHAAAAYSTGAEQVRAATLRGLTARGRSGCAAYRDAAALRLDRLDATSITDARTLADRYLEMLDCLCDAVNPPCPSCTDPRVLLARIQVEGCNVVEVCSVVRRWVPGPRTLGYWLPIEQLLHGLLDKRCCAACQRKQEVSESGTSVSYLRQFAREAAFLVRPPADDPALQLLMSALGATAPATSATAPATSSTAPGADHATPPATGAAAPQAAPVPTASPATSGAGDRIRQLEEQIAALTRRIDQLTAAPGGGRS